MALNPQLLASKQLHFLRNNKKTLISKNISEIKQKISYRSSQIHNKTCEIRESYPLLMEIQPIRYRPHKSLSLTGSGRLDLKILPGRANLNRKFFRAMPEILYTVRYPFLAALPIYARLCDVSENGQGKHQRSSCLILKI